jgi:hypothetical protein
VLFSKNVFDLSWEIPKPDPNITSGKTSKVLAPDLLVLDGNRDPTKEFSLVVRSKSGQGTKGR